jgi:hypothetical protein
LGRKSGSYKFEKRQKELRKQQKRSEKMEKRQNREEGDEELEPVDLNGPQAATPETD